MFVCPECGESYWEDVYCTADGTRVESRADDPLLGETIGAYRVARLIGVGGMGRVYKGVNPAIGSRVAIKVLSSDCASDQELVERFFAEAKAVNVIRHENIVNVLNLDRLPDGRPFIIMEFLDGAPLSKVIGTRGPLPLGSFARVIGECLSALGAAHAAGIIHRDLKPDNIYVTPHGRAKVLDFGIAKLTGDALGVSAQTRDGSLMGTPHYMSPEQAQARQIDPRTDIYAVGVILFEGVTGEQPFEAEALYDLLRMHVETPPPAPRSLRHDLPAEYEAVILRALSKHPDQRQPNAKTLYRELVEATRHLTEAAWEPIGEQESRMSVGMSAIPTPAGPPTPSAPHEFPMGGQTPQRVGPAPSDAPPPPLVKQPTPPAAGQAFHQPQVVPAPNRTALYAVLAISAVAAIGTGIFFGTRGGGEAANENGGEGPVAEANDSDSGAERGDNVVGAHPGSGHVYFPSSGSGTDQLPPHPNQIGSSDWPMDKNFLGRRDTPSPTEIDVSGFLAKATELARVAFKDAQLARIDAYGVRQNGKADVTLGDNGIVIYHFISPAATKRPADLPLGVEHNPNCRYSVMLNKDMTIYNKASGFCEWPALGPPKCTAEQVWRKAAKKGAPTGNVVAQLGFWENDKTGRGRWMFTIGDKHFMWLPDDC